MTWLRHVFERPRLRFLWIVTYGPKEAQDEKKDMGYDRSLQMSETIPESYFEMLVSYTYSQGLRKVEHQRVKNLGTPSHSENLINVNIFNIFFLKIIMFYKFYIFHIYLTWFDTDLII
jgi:hypothetical protein